MSDHDKFSKLARVYLQPSEAELFDRACEALKEISRAFHLGNPKQHIRLQIVCSQLWSGDAPKIECYAHLGTDWCNQGKGETVAEALSALFAITPAAALDNQIRTKQQELKDLRRERRRL